MPLARAILTTPNMFRVPVLLIMFLRWLSTVCKEMKSRSAISWLVKLRRSIVKFLFTTEKGGISCEKITVMRFGYRNKFQVEKTSPCFITEIHGPVIFAGDFPGVVQISIIEVTGMWS
jgi:hypothetical protein